jgi:hypothetical protein
MWARPRDRRRERRKLQVPEALGAMLVAEWTAGLFESHLIPCHLTMSFIFNYLGQFFGLR